ncbi:DNA-processing protein DprA [Rothia sp. (in: high G+C Gram-positive bacteria)]|uniref:DNA-processing protein DprA n=1 Tax=Rothia sp. (in: high G+C Gram-positive bacteria) TaxID=1885016 RepID=UPI0025DF3123|nr:DNA-processing protein DprA [Rothia sp. (in: high G+C Gram-positive bacteria)]
MPEEHVPEERTPEESAAEVFVQEELQIRLPGRTLDAHALVRERVAHILSLGHEPSPSPYNAARLPGFLASCLNPVYLDEPVYLEEMRLEEMNQQEHQGEHPEPAAGTSSSSSDPAPLLNPAPLFNPALSAEQVEAACREYIRCCTAQLMRYAEPADELVVESLTTLGAPLTLHYLLTGHIPDEHTWEHGEPDTQLSDFLHSVGAPAEGESALFCSANGYYMPGGHQMSRDKFGKALATRRLRWNRRMERTLNAEAHMAATCGAWLVTPADPLWPPQLNDLGPDRPYGLWCRGDSRHLLDLASAPSVALVGSRDPSIYGTEATTHLAAELARRGYTVISGGAMGIDIAAHRAALTQQGSDLPTIAFMAGGLDRLYPAQNSDALNMIVDRGLIMSEVSVGNTPTRWRFLERNRLIAALARHTIVVEARWRSGALNTARHAMEIGRTLWAVPGQINSPNSVGTNRLLRDGLAQTLTEAADILEYDAVAGFELGTEHESEWDRAVSSSALDELTERQGRVWDDLSPRSYRGVDEIAAALGLSARDVMADLFHLGRCGLAESSGTSWRKVRPATAA